MEFAFASSTSPAKRALRRKIPLLFGDKALKQLVSIDFILKRALKQTHSVCLRAI
jgi:hypothetical protein